MLADLEARYGRRVVFTVDGSMAADAFTITRGEAADPRDVVPLAAVVQPASVDLEAEERADQAAAEAAEAEERALEADNDDTRSEKDARTHRLTMKKAAMDANVAAVAVAAEVVERTRLSAVRKKTLRKKPRKPNLPTMKRPRKMASRKSGGAPAAVGGVVAVVAETAKAMARPAQMAMLMRTTILSRLQKMLPTVRKPQTLNR
jgi:hypothetical protein